MTLLMTRRTYLMIKKFPRTELNAYSQKYISTPLYNLRLYDKNNNTFTMMVGGNGDLYWIPDNYKQVQQFVIDVSDRYAYKLFDRLFSLIDERDNKRSPLLQDNTFTFISEDFPEDIAHTLKITKTEQDFTIDFVKNETESMYSGFRRGCPICFCNSGSRVPKIEQLFMLMFTHLAYETPTIELEPE